MVSHCPNEVFTELVGVRLIACDLLNYLIFQQNNYFENPTLSTPPMKEVLIYYKGFWLPQEHPGLYRSKKQKPGRLLITLPRSKRGFWLCWGSFSILNHILIMHVSNITRTFQMTWNTLWINSQALEWCEDTPLLPKAALISNPVLALPSRFTILTIYSNIVNTIHL